MQKMSNAETGYPLAGRIRDKGSKDRRQKGGKNKGTTAAVRQG